MIRTTEIDQVIYKLTKKYDTRDPFRIAKQKGIIVLFEDLGDIYGYYNKVNRTQFIHINRNREIHEQLFTGRHELGHAIQHPNENTPLLSSFSLHSEILIEAEANYFATQLTIDNSHSEYITTKYELLRYYGLPMEMERFL